MGNRGMARLGTSDLLNNGSRMFIWFAKWLVMWYDLLGSSLENSQIRLKFVSSSIIDSCHVDPGFLHFDPLHCLILHFMVRMNNSMLH
jgi:hypothetical protein